MHAHELSALGILRHGPGRRLPPKDGRMQKQKSFKKFRNGRKTRILLML